MSGAFEFDYSHVGRHKFHLWRQCTGTRLFSEIASTGMANFVFASFAKSN